MADGLRASTDDTTPLLRDPEREGTEQSHSSSFSTTHFSSSAQVPLTWTSKVLLILCIVLLLVCSVFVGLFAGAQHKLSVGRGRQGENGTSTITATTTHGMCTATDIKTGSATLTVPETATSSPAVPVPTTVPIEKVCNDPGCVILSASILMSLDTSQDPCENFYDFANGAWLRDHPVPADKSSFGRFLALQQQNNRLLLRIIDPEEPLPNVHDPVDIKLLEKLRGFFSSCVKEDQLDNIGMAPLFHLAKTIKRLFREDDTDITSMNQAGRLMGRNVSSGLTAALAFIHSRGIDSLFKFYIEGDVGVDPDRMSLWFSQPTLGLPSKEYFEEKDARQIYQRVVERLLLVLDDEEKPAQSSAVPVLVMNEERSNDWPHWRWPPWGDDENPVNRTIRIRNLAHSVVNFEGKLAKASLDPAILEGNPLVTYNPLPLCSLKQSIPQIDFPTYLASFGSQPLPEKVIMTYPAYAASVSDILEGTPSDVVEAYLVVRAALGMSGYLSTSTEAWQAERSLTEALTGIKKGAVGDRGEYCTAVVGRYMGFATGRYFVNETFNGASQEKATRVITDIIGAFKNSLSHIDWMDAQSAKAASEKAAAIRVKVGYPSYPDTLDPRSVASYYEDVKVDGINFFESCLTAKMSKVKKEWAMLGRRRDIRTWEMFPSTVNAYYNPPSNEIVFPAGILQPPFFRVDWPGYMSYGAFGQVVSHELTHAFDSAGRLYNQHGKLEEWWTNSTSEGYKVKQECIENQYSQYTIDDGKGGKIHVNGNLTASENIGDSGIIQAYRAWKAQYQLSWEAGNEYLLPGLNFTRDQLFFIAFARLWGGSMKPAAAVARIRTDPHSPSRYRVEGTLSNVKEFAEAFKCPEGAKLNPPRESQCIFWS